MLPVKSERRVPELIGKHCIFQIYQPVNRLRLRQNGRHIADDIFKFISLNENGWILIKSTMKFISKGPVNNIPALV